MGYLHFFFLLGPAFSLVTLTTLWTFSRVAGRRKKAPWHVASAVSGSKGKIVAHFLFHFVVPFWSRCLFWHWWQTKITNENFHLLVPGRWSPNLLLAYRAGPPSNILCGYKCLFNWSTNMFKCRWECFSCFIIYI